MKKSRALPGTTGEGNFYRIVIRPKSQFILFRNHDVGGIGHIERIAGKRSDGTWDTQCWLVDKKDAKIIDNHLTSKIDSVKELFSTFEHPPEFVKGDIFKTKIKESVKSKIKEATYTKNKTVKDDISNSLLIP